MKHFIDKVKTVSNQCTDNAIILDSKAKRVGSVVIRYTNAQIGCNNEIGVIFDDLIDFSTTKKGNTYDHMNLFYIFHDLGIKCFDGCGNQINEKNQGSYSRNNELVKLKMGNKIFNLEWI